jgi:hypothetical protein
MCWSANVSISTWLFGMFAYLWGLSRGKDLGLFYLWYTQMQLLEYFMWKDQECKGTNQIASKLGYINILLQPLLSIYTYYPNKWLYLLYALLITQIRLPTDFCSRPNPNSCHLSWPWLPFEKVTLAVWFVLQFLPPFMTTKEYFLSGMLAYLYSFNRSQGSIGSLWCWIVVLYGIVAFR